MEAKDEIWKQVISEIGSEV
ncbi:hypothetical protein CCACVL1_11365 [Corchorus capsularis]|uniref:Uncharacterized protein n=1 Tax=Corchorus capsularis TaxID=210143 RepID=A0A1R3ILP8_COCAP|nr:hypothetical protein CCACVL1_11365 [Corchorus capsularis]